MGVFISWSGENSPSHELAKILHKRIKNIVQHAQCYLSSKDIVAGALWGEQLFKQLGTDNIGLVCLTSANLNRPWIHFEAGALAIKTGKSRVCPLLIDLKKEDVPPPLSMFQFNLGRLICLLGSSVERPPFRAISEDIWHFDTECIYAHGDYTKIARRLMQLSNGLLSITNIRDALFLDEQVAYLEFDFQGQRFHWELEVNDDWIDSTVFTRFVELFETIPSAARFTYADLGGQDCLIGFSTPKQAKALTELTGILFTRLR